jgi:hypothetical protein
VLVVVRQLGLSPEVGLGSVTPKSHDCYARGKQMISQRKTWVLLGRDNDTRNGVLCKCPWQVTLLLGSTQIKGLLRRKGRSPDEQLNQGSDLSQKKESRLEDGARWVQNQGQESREYWKE